MPVPEAATFLEVGNIVSSVLCKAAAFGQVFESCEARSYWDLWHDHRTFETEYQDYRHGRGPNLLLR